jgi:hypothetical protein
MIRDLTDVARNLNSRSQSRHDTEIVAWKQAAETALNHPGFHNKDPQIQLRLLKLFRKSVFLRGSGRLLLRYGLPNGTRSTNYIMPTTSDEAFSRISVRRGEDAFTTRSHKRRVVTIGLRPSAKFSPITRQEIIAHELMHVDDAFNDTISTLTAEAMHDVSESELDRSHIEFLLPRVFMEIRAHKVGSIVLDNATNGEFGAYLDEVSDVIQSSLHTNDVTLPAPDNYLGLDEVNGCSTIAFIASMGDLHATHVVSTPRLVRAMVSSGLVGSQFVVRHPVIS